MQPSLQQEVGGGADEALVPKLNPGGGPVLLFTVANPMLRASRTGPLGIASEVSIPSMRTGQLGRREAGSGMAVKHGLMQMVVVPSKCRLPNRST